MIRAALVGVAVGILWSGMVVLEIVDMIFSTGIL